MKRMKGILQGLSRQRGICSTTANQAGFFSKPTRSCYSGLFKFFVVVAVFFIGSYAAADVSEGLVARWDFNGHIRDVSGNGYDGRWGESEIAPEGNFDENVPGTSGQAFRFNGEENVISHAAIDFEISENHTFTVWQYLPEDAPRTWNAVLGSSWLTGGYWFYHHGGVLSHFQDVYDGETYIFSSDLRMGEEIPLGEWFHLAVAAAPADIEEGELNYRIYVDGDLVKDFTARWSPRAKPKQFRYLNIGGAPPGRRRFTGLMDDLRIYSRSLSADEVRKIYELRGD